MNIHKDKKLMIILAITIILAIACIVMGFYLNKSFSNKLAATEFKVTGDVTNELRLQNFDDFKTVKIKVDEESYEGVKLADLLKKAAPQGESIAIYLSAPDGVRAEIEYEQIFHDSVVYFSKEYGFTFNSPSHPVQSGIKQINNIVVVANEPNDTTPGLRIIAGGKDTFYTCGQIFLQDKKQMMVLEGEPLKESVMTNAYSTRELIPISELIAEHNTNVVGYFLDGSEAPLDKDGYVLWRGNTIDYIGSDGKSISEDIIGIWGDAPKLSVTDIRKMADEEKNDLMIIEIDGLGVNTFIKYQPEFLYAKGFEEMSTVMPSISPVALASIVSGETPNVTGIKSRKERELLTDDMFKGKNAVVVEGYSQLITMSVDQILNPDRNKDGSTDDEVFASATKEMAKKPEIAYIHFHGYDDVSHDFGPYSKEAETKLHEIDGYIKQLSNNFDGTVYIVSDHGQHSTPNGKELGSHGMFIYEDMLVPFITY